MQLTIIEAARLLKVSDDVIYKWIREDDLPASRFGDCYHLNRVKVIEWAHENRIPVAVENGHGLPTLEAALSIGGVHDGIQAKNKESVVQEILKVLPLGAGIDRDLLQQMILSREKQGSTAVGDGIAIPHARYPMLLGVSQPFVALCYLADPIEYGAPDGQPIFALFTLVSATVRDHLHLLSHLAMALHDENFRQLVEQRSGREKILGRIHELEDAKAHRPPAGKTNAA